FTVGLYSYEYINIDGKKQELARLNVRAQQLEKEATQYGSVNAIVEDLNKEKKKLTEQLSVIQKISQKRAYKLKAIRSIQENLPEDLWLKEMIVDRAVVRS